MHTPEQKAHWMALWRQATAECDTTEAFVTRFAALVAASERERCAKLCERLADKAGGKRFTQADSAIFDCGPIFAAAIRNSDGG